MVDSPFALYKLIILYALHQASFPLTNSQLSDLFLSKEYTSYFHLQEVLSDMEESGLLYAETTGHATYYRMSPQGENTIQYFANEISPAIRREITDYLQDHAHEIRNDGQITADYAKTPEQDYAVHCRVMEGNSALIDLTLTVPTESAARTLTENWKQRSQEAYEELMKLLTS